MPIEVEIPDVGVIEFPDEMSEDQINAVIRSQFSPATAPAPSPTPREPASAPPDAASQFFGGETVGETITTQDEIRRFADPNEQKRISLAAEAESLEAERAKFSIGKVLTRAELGMRAGARAIQAGLEGFLAQVPVQPGILGAEQEAGRQAAKADEAKATRRLESIQAEAETYGGGRTAEIAQQLSGAIPGIAATVPAMMATGFGGAIVASGLVGAFSRLPEAKANYRALHPTWTEDQITRAATQTSLISGAITSVVTAAFGRTGIEALGRGLTPSKLKDVATWVFGKLGIMEGAEEITDQAWQSVLSKLQDRPDMTIGDVVTEGLTAFAGGTLLGAGTAAGWNLTQRIAAKLPDISKDITDMDRANRVAVNLAAPGTVRPTEQELYVPPEAEAPAEMVSVAPELPLSQPLRVRSVRVEDQAAPEGPVLKRGGGQVSFARTAESTGAPTTDATQEAIAEERQAQSELVSILTQLDQTPPATEAEQRQAEVRLEEAASSWVQRVRNATAVSGLSETVTGSGVTLIDELIGRAKYLGENAKQNVRIITDSIRGGTRPEAEEGRTSFRQTSEEIGAPTPDRTQSAVAAETLAQSQAAGATEALITTQKAGGESDALQRQETQRQGDVTTTQTSTEAGATTASTEFTPPSSQAVGITPTVSPEVAHEVSKAGSVVVGPFRIYSERLATVLARMGGPMAKEFAGRVRTLIDRGKQLMGSIAPQINAALEKAGSNSKAIKWLNGIEWDANGVGTRRLWKMEDPANVAALPADVRQTFDVIDNANRLIGGLILRGAESGKFQRMPTIAFLDIVRGKRGSAYEKIKQAIMRLNSISDTEAEAYLNAIRDDSQDPDIGGPKGIRKASQEYERKLPHLPTHIKHRGQVIDLFISEAHNYLREASLRTATRAAFKEEFPNPSAFSRLRDEILKELGGVRGQPEHFDRLVRALHGLPIDDPLVYRKMIEPGGIMDLYIGRPWREMISTLSALALSGAAIPNIPELAFGTAGTTMGLRQYIQGLWALRKADRRQLLTELGAVDKVVRDWSVDPAHPIASRLRNFRQLVRKFSALDLLNEIQGKAAGSAAVELSRQARAGELGVVGKSNMDTFARALEFTPQEAQSLADGTASDELYRSFIVRAPAYATGENQHPAELSRFGASRTAMNWFRFQTYPMVKLNAARQIYGNLLDMSVRGDPKSFLAALNQASKFTFGTIAQGAGIAFLGALVKGGLDGVEEKTNEAIDDSGRFVRDALLSGFGGPLALIFHLSEAPGSTIENAAQASYPVSEAMELTMLFQGKGRYANMTMPERIGRYVTLDIPGARIGKGILSLIGLSKEDTTLTSAIGGLKRWKRQTMGYTLVDKEEKALTEDRIRFRQQMRRVVDSLSAGRDDWRDHLREAIKLSPPGQPVGSAAADSLRMRKLLVDNNRNELTSQAKEALKKRIGDRFYQRLEQYDAMIQELSNSVRSIGSED